MPKKKPLLVDEIEYLVRIKTHYNILSESEKKIADYIMNNKDEILGLSAHALADKIGTSASTVVRFCYSLGFKGYTELKFYIERELLSPSYEVIQVNPGDSINLIKQKMLNFNKDVIDDTTMILDSEKLEQAVKALSTAPRIDLYGEGGSGSITVSAANLFLQIGLSCNAYTDSFMQITSATQLKKGDVALAIIHSGRARNTIEALQEAHKQGATTICITGYTNSPITEHSDIVLYTSSKSTGFLSDLPAARISELCVISVLQMAIVAGDYDKYIVSIKKSKEAFKLKRVPE
ncbi:MAG: RpiR family transcriptional regulator [Clostridiales bacterium]|jgi:DNA-binding MurR/RpiR family transcriptional regulator|nr:RpiR family transcriptional regulator [Clostridiales bacterium]